MMSWITAAWDTVSSFFSAHAGEVSTIVVVYLAGRIGLSVLCRFILRRLDRNGGDRHHKRLQTVASLVRIVLHTLLLITVGIWILRLFGVDPSPIFASAGIMGLAVGFGAQTLVRDFLSGMFIIVENQYAVGDWVRINGQEGVVRVLSIRHTLLEDIEGNRIYIPNGTISLVTNLKEMPKVEEKQ